MTEKIPLKAILLAADFNSKELWDELDETQRKSINLWTLNRFISSVSTPNKEQQQYYVSVNREQQEHYVLSVNEFFNKHWFDLQKHPKLLWMLLCMCSWDNESNFYHEWIGLTTKHKTSKKFKLLSEIYPNLNDLEIQILASKMTNDELKDLAREIGWTEKDVKDI
jgi:hypothetical protein